MSERKALMMMLLFMIGDGWGLRAPHRGRNTGPLTRRRDFNLRCSQDDRLSGKALRTLGMQNMPY